jgi:hypothetical protein
MSELIKTHTVRPADLPALRDRLRAEFIELIRLAKQDNRGFATFTPPRGDSLK